MLEQLFGHGNIEKILFFLLLNNQCYASQIHRSLHVPLTPIQKALDRLEEGGIVGSRYEGNRRIYQFQTSYLLLAELKALLQKAYANLPPEEKKRYFYVPKVPGRRERRRQQFLSKIWTRMQTVCSLRTCFLMGTGEKGQGHGEVIPKLCGKDVLLFEERGVLAGDQRGQHSFFNTYRWTLDRWKGVLSLEHLRRGPKHPTFLFHLIPSLERQCLESAHPHICDEDIYFAHLYLREKNIHLSWRMVGPQMNDEMQTIYE